MPPKVRTGFYPAVGQAIPHRWTGFSRVTHPSATESESCPSNPVRLTCVTHAASVRPEPGSNSPMIEEFEQLFPNDGPSRLAALRICRPNQSQSKTPRDAHLTARSLNRGRTPHTRSSILKERLRTKTS